ncbi:hypothetical protein FZC84_00705 [Rossellomorea vietnamensis]|uniref:Uncharacterized protein n=1 Tax=Rossellomorea vietnamensis TaxID=218284 RepID=A0A5D4MHK9_9BACI|nr:hypothetical protein [Rossellomorea vietnamensis]TYS01223.1 hypothetical protein FZC84_00705 [Rossellomorea vietnamensis]
MKVNTNETWLSLLEEQIEKKAKKDIKIKEEYPKLLLQVEMLKMENALLQEKIKNFQEINIALSNIQIIAAVFNDSLTTIMENKEKEDSFEQRLKRIEKSLAVQTSPANVMIQEEKDYVTKDVFLEEIGRIENKLKEKRNDVENPHNKRESNAEGGSIGKKAVRRRITPDINSTE